MTLTPASPDTGDTLLVTASGSSDADGHNVSYSYVWYLNGALTNHATSAITSADTNKGEAWTVRVTANDGYHDGQYTGVLRGDCELRTGDQRRDCLSSCTQQLRSADLQHQQQRCRRRDADRDHHLEQSDHWCHLGHGRHPAAEQQHGQQRRRHSVRGGGGGFRHLGQRCHHRQRGQHRPGVHQRCGHRTGQRGDHLEHPQLQRCGGGHRRQPAQSQLQLGGSQRGHELGQRGVGDAEPQQRQPHRCGAVHHHGHRCRWRECGSSDSVQVSNSAPSVSGVSIQPASGVTTSSSVSCSATVSDADVEQLSATYAWSNGSTGVALGSGASVTLSAQSIQPGESVVCTASATDGYGASDSASASLVVENSVPVIASVTITPANPYNDDSLNFAASASDADGQTLTTSVNWVNASTGTGLGLGANLTLSAATAMPGETIECTVDVDDGAGAAPA